MLLSSHCLLLFCRSDGWKGAAAGGGSGVASSFFPFYTWGMFSCFYLSLARSFLFLAPAFITTQLSMCFFCPALLFWWKINLAAFLIFRSFRYPLSALDSITLTWGLVLQWCSQQPRMTTIDNNSYKYWIVVTMLATPSHSALLVAPRLPELLIWEWPRAQPLISFYIPLLPWWSHPVSCFKYLLHADGSKTISSLASFLNSKLVYLTLYPVSPLGWLIGILKQTCPIWIWYFPSNQLLLASFQAQYMATTLSSCPDQNLGAFFDSSFSHFLYLSYSKSYCSTDKIHPEPDLISPPPLFHLSSSHYHLSLGLFQ